MCYKSKGLVLGPVFNVRSNTSNCGKVFILSFCHATYLLKTLMRFRRHAKKINDHSATGVVVKYFVDY